MKRINLLILITLMLVYACNLKPVNENAKNKNPILNDLLDIKGKGILFGHQDDLAYGMGWSYVDGESDVKRVAGDYPALFGWELGGIEIDQTVNLDSVPFNVMRELAVKAHKLGGINTFSWHPYSVVNGKNSWNTDTVVVRHILPDGSNHPQFVDQLDKVAAFFNSLKDEHGESIPFIFRPWHEMDGAWFWWGSKLCTPEELKSLFSFTIDYLRNKKGLKKMVVAYSPDRNFNTVEEYFTWYPGDEIVDILGVDNYYDLKRKNGEQEAIRKLHLVIGAAKSKNMPVAFTETGLENVTDSLWFTGKLGAVLSDSLINRELSYVMVWRSDPQVHFFFPYPGHPAAPDAKALLSRPDILLLNEFNQLKK